MLIEALEKEKREVYKKAKREGRREGKRENKTETARKMIAKGFDLPLISELIGLSDDAIIKLKQEMDAQRN
jgi:predicted transposase/invertase (TIGR01784 family)